ncbi:hypothetical protein L1887_05743 [Cichorium endivia]|nr:hypothetical protein L1887_05743 [Cichorium endivia]
MILRLLDASSLQVDVPITKVGLRVINDYNAMDLSSLGLRVVNKVANYCRDRLHLASEEELKTMKQELIKGTIRSDGKSLYKMLSKVALATVGSTDVVALIYLSHIIIAKYNDSRVILYRGKEAMALSNDHKVTHFVIVINFD